MSVTHPPIDMVVGTPKCDMLATPHCGFSDAGLLDWLEQASADDLDILPFGLIAMSNDGTVEQYNIVEGQMAGLAPKRVIGRNFFTSVAPCTNNFMVAHRFLTEPELNTVIDYVFTFKLAPQTVRLRLMKRLGGKLIYLAVERRE